SRRLLFRRESQGVPPSNSNVGGYLALPHAIELGRPAQQTTKSRRSLQMSGNSLVPPCRFVEAKGAKRSICLLRSRVSGWTLPRWTFADADFTGAGRWRSSKFEVRQCPCVQQAAVTT